MAGIERADIARVDLSSKSPFKMTFHAKDHDRNLGILEPNAMGASTTPEAQDLLRTLMLAHLIAKHYPKTIETNFEVGSRVFLDKLYEHYGFLPPRIKKSEDQVKPEVVADDTRQEKIEYANAHSGGLDSIYRVVKLLSAGDKVLISHIRNLNPSGRSAEAIASRKQAASLGLPYLETTLLNGTDNSGFAVMRTRDMFLGLITAMAGEAHQVEKVYIEGDMQTDTRAHFSEYEPAWDFFNKLITDVGLHSQVDWFDAHDIETVGEVLGLEKERGLNIIPMVQNCFTAPNKLNNNRGKWERETSEIAKNSPPHWCGSCPKCRRMTLGRLYYEDPRFDNVSKREVQYFIEDTYKWLDKYPENRALISQSFMDHLAELGRRF